MGRCFLFRKDTFAKKHRVMGLHNMSDYDKFIETLGQLGEEKVRQNLSQNIWANQRKACAEKWLQSCEISRENDRAERALALAERANDIANSASAEARSAKKWSTISIIVAAIIGVVSTIVTKSCS